MSSLPPPLSLSLSLSLHLLLSIPLSLSLIHTLREHTSWIHRVFVQQPVNNIISIRWVWSDTIKIILLFVIISSKGELCKWDPRFMKPVHGFTTLPETNVCALHQSANLLAWLVISHTHIYYVLTTPFHRSASHQAIKLFNLDTSESINSIRYHDGFMGQRIGPTKTLAFHPYKVMGSNDPTPIIITVNNYYSYGWLQVELMG